jgi:curved DNA-binding protein
MGDDYYVVLSVDRNATYEAVKAAYHKLALENHPDRSQGQQAADKFRAVHEAWKVLGDPLLRAEYDKAVLEEGFVGSNAEKVPLDSFRLVGNRYSRPCRCGCHYSVRV